MRRFAVLVFVVSVIAVIPGVVGPSSAGDLLFDNFLYYHPWSPIEMNPGDWIPLANVVDDPANNIWATTPASDNAVSMQLYGAHSGCNAAVANGYFPVPDNAAGLDLFVRFDMMASGQIDNVSGAVCPENLYDIQASLHTDNAASPATSIYLMSIRNSGWTGIDNLFLQRNRWYNVLVKINRAAGMKEYWVDGAPWPAVQDNAVLLYGPSARYVAFSSGGGKGWIDRVRVFTDTVAPVTAAAAGGTAGLNGWYKSAVSVSLTSNEPNSSWTDGSGTQRTEYSLDAGGHWTTYYAPFTESADGVYAIDYRSVDNAGNMEAFKVLTFSVDKTAPLTSVSLSGTLGENAWFVSDVTVGFQPFDNTSGVAYTEYSLDNTVTWLRYAGPVTISTDGVKNIQYRSADVAGNLEMTRTVTVKIDRTAPTSNPVVFPANGATRVSRSATITATYGEAVYQGAGFAGIEVYNVKTGAPAAATASIGGQTLSIKPSSTLARTTQYRVTIPAQAVKDAAGNSQAAATVWYFTTGTK